MNEIKSLIEGIIEKQVKSGWGADRFDNMRRFVFDITKHYSEHFGYSQLDILTAIEGSRTYSALNFYQASKFPTLDQVQVFDTLDDLKKILPSKTFRCPMCKGESTNPYECNTDLEMEPGKICDWKSYGLFGCLGKGFTFTIKDTFLDQPRIETIFYPIDLEVEEGLSTS